MAAAGVAFALSVRLAAAAVIPVAPGASIQAAIDAAQDGDEVRVAVHHATQPALRGAALERPMLRAAG